VTPNGSSSVRFGSFVLDFEHRCVLNHGQRLHLTTRPFETLAYLIRNRDHTVSKDELLREVWRVPGVTPGSVEQAIRQIRDALGDELKEPRYIQTVWGEGYR
jgi:DNA-binding winged helix-turn-helix (wHTH) protein